MKVTSGKSRFAARPGAAGMNKKKAGDFVVFTIVANNYMPYAVTLMNSVKAQHPQSQRFIVICDEPHPSMNYADLPAEVLFSRDLGIADYSAMAFTYDVMES